MPIIENLSDNKVEEILGTELFKEWKTLLSLIKSKYGLEEVWCTAAKCSAVELKLRRGGKTLLSLFPSFPEVNKIGLLLIFGKKEREKFEEQADTFSRYTLATYYEAKTHHNGKWLMFLAPSKNVSLDFLSILRIKRKPNDKKAQALN